MITSRELVKKALKFEELERIPREMYFEDEFLLKNYPSDVGSPIYTYKSDLKKGVINQKGKWVDEWGCVWEAAEDGVKGEVTSYPLDDWSKLSTFKAPFEMLKTADMSQVNRSCEESDKFIIGFWETAASPFQRMQFLRGTENLFMDLAYGEEEIFKLRDIVHEFFMKQLEMWVKTDVDGIHLEDDWGTQTALLISPKLWRDFYKPLYKDYCDLAHKHGKYVLMHSDGYIMDIMEDLIEVGVDAINSQLFCMDMDEIERRFAGRICFWGEIDRQFLLPFGTENEVRSGVRKVANSLLKNKKTGVVAQSFWGKDIPMQNIRAVYDEWAKIL